MRKGLTQTLMAVAVVVMAAQAMAMAPIIGDIPSPIVGDQDPQTSSNTFVYPDAINLSAYVTDLNADQTPNDPNNIIWTYEIMDAQAKYRINNRDELAPGDDPINPPMPKRIDGPGSADEDPLGTNDAESKITIRNVNLSPIGGPNTDPGAPGIIAAETQNVTLYASDGSTVSATVVPFYTDNDGPDRLSGLGEKVYDQTFTGTVGQFGYTGLNSATSSYDSSTGALCITTIASGDNVGWWSGPFGMLPLVQNSVYKIRLRVNSSQATAGLVPFWDMIVNNFGWDDPSLPQAQRVLKGLNLYGMNYMFLDNTGNANAAVSGRNTMDFVAWYAPSAFATPQWNDTSSTQPGPWAPSENGNNDAFIEFRILDAASNAGTNGSVSLGTLCMTELSIERFDYSKIQSNSSKLDINAFTSAGIDGQNAASPPPPASAVRGFQYGTSTIAFTGGAVTITPAGSGAGTNGVMLAEVQPGDFTFDFGQPATVTDNYPVSMQPQTLYRIRMDISAPTAADENAPLDIFWLGADTPTNELINLSYVTNTGWRHGMPKAGTPQTYVAFFFSNYATASTNPAHFSQFRWRWMGGNNQALGGGGEPNTGSVRLHNVKVDQVSF